MKSTSALTSILYFWALANFRDIENKVARHYYST